MTEFEEVYRKHFDDVYRYIRRLSGDESTAEEITSEVFLKAMLAIDRFRGECDLRVWLCQIAKNCYFTHMKQSNRSDSVTDTVFDRLPAAGPSTEDQCIERSEADRIRAVLHDLKEPYKEVFMWRTFAELSFKQIGQMFGRSANWACVTYHRAKNMIRAESEEKDE